MKKVIRLTESDLEHIVKRVIEEQESDTSDESYNDFKKHFIERFKSEITRPTKVKDPLVEVWLSITMGQIRDKELRTDEMRLNAIELLLGYYLKEAEESFELTQEQYDDLDDTMFDIVLEYTR
jgi:hypothetical protein